MHDKKRTVLGILAAIFFTLPLVAAQAPKPAPDSATPETQQPPSQQPEADSAQKENARGLEPVLQHRNRRYKLHSADVLELVFPFTPEFNQIVTVEPDGYITLRETEGVRVVGQTLPEVVTTLKTAYAKVLKDPVINVALKDFEKPFFIVGGEVGHPGKFELREDTTTAEGVAIAGGLRDSAKHSEVLLFHRVPDGWVQAKKINLKKTLKQGNLNEDAYLQPGDFVYVPKNAMSKISKFIPTSSLGIYANPGVL